MDDYPGNNPPTGQEPAPYSGQGAQTPLPYQPQPQPQAQPPYHANGQEQIPTPPPPPQYPAGEAYTSPALEPQPASTGLSRRALITIGVGLLVIILIGIGTTLGGEFGRFVSVGAQIFPLAILAALAYGGRKNQVARVFTYIALAVVAIAGFGISFLSTIEVLIKPEALTNPGSVANPFKPGAGASFIAITLLLMLGAAASSAMLLRPVRVFVAKIMPVDPDNFVHMIALCVLTLIFFACISPLIALGGQPPILELMNAPAIQQAGAAVQVSPLDIIYQFVWMIPSTLVAAGWLVARNFPEVLKRLGMVKPTVVQVIAGIALGVVFAFLSGFLDQGIHWVFTTMGWPTTNTEAFGQLLKGVTNPAGAVLIGVTAGIGEEMAVRGLLQPRLGIIASNLIFTSLHALQYGVDALLSVFIIGLVLGIIRSRSNTSTSAIVHGVYDFTVVLASVFS